MQDIVTMFFAMAILVIGIKFLSLLIEIRQSNIELKNHLERIEARLDADKSKEILHDILYWAIGRFGKNARPLNHDLSPMWCWEYLKDDDGDWDMYNDLHKNRSAPP